MLAPAAQSAEWTLLPLLTLLRRTFRVISIVIVAALLSGCTFGTLTYRSAFISDSKSGEELPGQALLVLSEEEQSRVMINKIIEDRTQNVELGAITRGVALTLLKKSFDDGVVLSPALTDMAPYQLAFEPRIVHLRYERLVEEKFASKRLIPRAEITLNVKAYTDAGAPVLDRIYESGPMRGEICYAMKFIESACEEHDGRMEELQNQLIHRMLFDMMARSLTDIADSGAIARLDPD